MPFLLAGMHMQNTLGVSKSLPGDLDLTDAYQVLTYSIPSPKEAQ
jgi:hypothetical protein